jgi:hypothetical protein
MSPLNTRMDEKYVDEAGHLLGESVRDTAFLWSERGPRPFFKRDLLGTGSGGRRA